jgi:SAM-dependent methyltransferase
VITNWQDLSWDPNAATVIAWQQQLLDATREPPVTRRIDYLRSLAANRRVLDVGVVEHGVQNEQTDNWLHRQIAEVADTILGVDVLEAAVDDLAARGWNVRCHDLCASPIPGAEFDVIVIGEVIEHLGAPQAMLHNLGAMLSPTGRVVVTTPNPYMLHRTIDYLRGRFPDSVDHVTLLSPPNIAELARRCGLQLDSWRGVQLKRLRSPRNTATYVARTLGVKATGNSLLNCDTVIYELVRSTDHHEPPQD